MSEITEPDPGSSEALEAIRRALSRMTNEKVSAHAAEKMSRQRVEQAEDELREIFNHARQQLRTVAPDADLRSTRGLLILKTNDVKLQVSIWQDMPRPVAGDTTAFAGVVEITNRWYSGPAARPPWTMAAQARKANSGGSETLHMSANIVYKIAGDRTAWQVYSFSLPYMPAPPQPRTYGLGRDDFLSRLKRDHERSSEPHSGQEPDPLTSCELTSEEVLKLFLEAVNLRSPPPRFASGL